MHTSMIFAFVGKYLEHHVFVTPTELNNFIKKDPAVGKAIDDKEIREALDQYVDFGWLEIEQSDEINPVYKRYITKSDVAEYQKQFRGELHRRKNIIVSARIA